jgi:hypothetical protein
LAEKLLVERLRRRPIQLNHFKSNKRTPPALLRARFPIGHAICANFASFPFAVVFSNNATSLA